MTRAAGAALWALATAFLPGCAVLSDALQGGRAESATAGDGALQARLDSLWPTRVLLIGEQHDAAEHQQMQHQVVQALLARQRLGALALEMAEQGRHTRHLPAHASEAQVLQALAWPERVWPWPHYRDTVMAAVRAGVPVLGANLPAARMRAAMQDAALDDRLPSAALAQQMALIRQGHCNALPAAQVMPMTRIQIARDMAMADTLQQALPLLSDGQAVALIGGNVHMHRRLGVPVHLPAALTVRVLSAQAGMPIAGKESEQDEGGALQMEADVIWHTPALPLRDYCARFREATRHRPATGAPPPADKPER